MVDVGSQEQQNHKDEDGVEQIKAIKAAKTRGRVPGEESSALEIVVGEREREAGGFLRTH